MPRGFELADAEVITIDLTWQQASMINDFINEVLNDDKSSATYKMVAKQLKEKLDEAE